jgi:hypothetical protein
MFMRLLTTTLLLSLLFVNFALGKQAEKFSDFSHKGSDYASLENLRFAAADIQCSGSELVDILGKPYSASRFTLKVTVTVQTLSALGADSELSVYEKRPANFDVFVVDDRDRSIHHGLVTEMYATWKKKKLFSRDYFFDFRMTKNRYVLTAMPDSINVKSFYFIWVNGRAIKVVFKGFEDNAKGGWGVMDSFASEAFRISVDGYEFQAYQYPLQVRKRFVKLYEDGFFNSPSSPH